jgi:hypothetical protein
MTVELVFNKLTCSNYTSCDAVYGFLRAHRLRPCCGLCGSEQISLVASRFLNQVLPHEPSPARIAATFCHLNEREQTQIFKLLQEEQYAGLRKKSKLVWSFTYLLQGAPPVSHDHPKLSLVASVLKGPSFQQFIIWAGNLYADCKIHMDSLLSLIKSDQEVVRQQLVQFYNAVVDQFCEDCFSNSANEALNKCMKKFANDPHYKELWQFLSENAEHSAPELFATGLLNRPANQEKADPVAASQKAGQDVKALKELINTYLHGGLARKAAGPALVESTSAKPQAAPVVSLPIVVPAPISVVQTKPVQPTHHYNLRSRKPVV